MDICERYTVKYRSNRQSMYCTYSITLWSVRETIITVEKQYIVHIMSASL